MTHHQIINLQGKIALITGTTSGIGWSTALLFKKLGASLLVTGRNQERLGKLVDELDALKTEGTVHALQADVTKEQDVQELFKSLKTHFNDKLDILVNNAGILEAGSIETTSLDQYDRIMNTNLRSIYHLTMLATPLLIASKGSIVNVSSVNGIRSFPNVLAYNISKAGLDQFTRCVAIELASKGVRVNSVNPGVTVTNIHKTGVGWDETAYQAFLEHS